MVGDVMDDAFGDEEAEDELVDQVLAELQIKATGDLVNAPTTEVGVAQKETVPEKQAVAEGAPVGKWFEPMSSHAAPVGGDTDSYCITGSRSDSNHDG